eukprot:TRINITY_DN82700_c0_g1_i1.p1 TRINITY_DN82700_c0_g1~~TRINITY_DN82700_c0_g1_i1.p1  ORF type:complete len:416 (+),score=51.83 TRINITY_DN82700_c0_g1_i1:369-1616(+)
MGLVQVTSIYSDYYSMEKGTQFFEQIPYYSIVERLTKENGLLAKEREEIDKILKQRQKELVRIENQLKTFSSVVQKSEEEKENMAKQLEKVKHKEGHFQIEAETAKIELRQLRKEVFGLKDQLEELTKKYETETERSTKTINTLRSNYHDNKHLLEQTRNELKEKSDYISPEVYNNMKEQIDHLMFEVDYLTQIKNQFEQIRQKSGKLTPRPEWSDFSLTFELPQNLSTSDIVQQIIDNYRTKEQELQRRLEFFQARQLPDSGGCNLNFLLNEDCTEIKGLGLGQDVPRYLRWNQQVPVLDWSKEEFEQEVDEILKEWYWNYQNDFLEFLQQYTRSKSEHEEEEVQFLYNLTFKSNQFASDSPLARAMNLVLTKQLHPQTFGALYEIQDGLKQLLTILTVRARYAIAINQINPFQ